MDKNEKLNNFKITRANILLTIEHREHNKCLNGEMLHIYSQNEIISNVMSATGLKLVGQPGGGGGGGGDGDGYRGVASPLLFKTD